MEIRSPIGRSKPESVKPAPWGKKFGDAKNESSSNAGNQRLGGIMLYGEERVRPRIDFWKRQQYYLTIGRVQNVTESFVLNIINRQWYYDSEKEGNLNEAAVKKMEEWEELVNASQMIGAIVRNWIVNGVHIVSPVDWVPLQLQSITSKKRDPSGKTEIYYQTINGVEKPLKASKFLEIPYIELDREPWGTGMYDSLMNVDYLDIDGKNPYSALDLYRQALQDNMKIHHKFSSPRVIYTAEGVAKEVLENDIIPVIEAMGPGDRAAFNENIEIKLETVDGNARFIEHVNKIIDEIDAGLQSSANRLITEPSAMADAGEANKQDDDRILGIMEKLRIFMNKEVIPRVTGLKPGEIVFKWGSKDAFDLEFPEPMQKAIELRILSPEKALLMLEDQYNWKFPSDDDVEAKLGIKPAVEPMGDEKPPEEKPEPIAAEAVHYESAELTEAKLQEIILSNKLKNEKILFIDKLNRELESVN